MRVEKFRIARAERNLGINQLARVLGVSTTAVSNWQNGKSKPKPEMLVRIAEALKVDPGYLDDTFNVSPQAGQPRVVADVLADARRELSRIMGMPESKIHLELRTHA
jgi:transcriptional regulator with XRE-family HTH domain